MSSISTNTELNDNENKLWKIKLDNGEERICGIKRGYKSKNLKTDKNFKELKEHKYVDKDLHDKLVKSGNKTEVNKDYYVIIEKDELKETIRDKKLYNSEHDLKHTSLSNSCESYATGKKIIGTNKLEDKPSFPSNGEEFSINNNNKNIFDNTNLNITYNKEKDNLQIDKKCYDPNNSTTRSNTLLTHKELKMLGKIYNISIKGSKKDICNRLYEKGLNFSEKLIENNNKIKKYKKKEETCYQLKKDDKCNSNNNCNYFKETIEDLRERLLLLDLLTNKDNNIDSLKKPEIIKKLSEYSKDYDKNKNSYRIRSYTKHKCMKKEDYSKNSYHKNFLKELKNKLKKLKEKDLLKKLNDYIKENKLLKKNILATLDNYNIILSVDFSKNKEEQKTQNENINKIIQRINELLPEDDLLDNYNINSLEYMNKYSTSSIEGDDLTSQDEDLISQDEDLTSQDEDLTSLNEDLTSLNEDLTSQDEDLTSLNEDLTSLNEDLTSLNEDEDEDEDLTSQDEDLTSLNEDLTILDEDEDEDEEDLNEIKSSKNELNNEIDDTKKLILKNINLKSPENYTTDEINNIKFIL